MFIGPIRDCASETGQKSTANKTLMLPIFLVSATEDAVINLLCLPQSRHVWFYVFVGCLQAGLVRSLGRARADAGSAEPGRGGAGRGRVRLRLRPSPAVASRDQKPGKYVAQ